MMTYSNRFVFCVLLNGKPQKELANGVVKLPFGSEYAIRLRNKNNKRAVVQIYIDGENVSGNGYIIDANDVVDIKRHHDVDRSFKFVNLDSEEAIEYGKNGPNDDKVKGTIEVRFYLEKEPPRTVYPLCHYPVPQTKPFKPYPRPWFETSPHYHYCDSSDIRSKSISAGSIQSRNASSDFVSSVPELQDGCTVEGNYTGQSFNTSWIETEDTCTTLKLFLQGFEGEIPVVAEPVKIRKTNKDRQLSELEQENEELKRKLAELENKRLKEEIAKLNPVEEM